MDSLFRNGRNHLRLRLKGSGFFLIQHCPCLGMLLRQFMLFLQLFLGAALLFLPDKLVLQLAQRLQEALRRTLYARGFLQHTARILGKLFCGILEFDFGHETLAPPHLIHTRK